MRRMLGLIALAAALIFAGSGCWDREELDNLGLILALGIDQTKDGRLEITAQIAIPSKLAGGGEGGTTEGLPVSVESAKGRSMPEAFLIMNRTLGRRISLAQNRLVIFGEELSRNGRLKELLDLLVRYREFRRTIGLVVTKETAKKTLATQGKLERNPAEYLLDLIRNSRHTGESYPLTLHDFMLDLASLGSAAYLPYIIPPPEKKEKAGGGGAQAQETGGNRSPRLGGLAVFKRERLTAIIPPNQVPAFLILAQRFTQTFVDIAEASTDGGISLGLAIQITSAKPRFLPKLSGGTAALDIEVKVEADLLGAGPGNNPSDEAQIASIERAVAGLLNNRMERLIEKAQREWRLDPFGFGEHFRSKFATWNRWAGFGWSKRFPAVPIKVKTRVYLRRVGFQNRAPEIKE